MVYHSTEINYTAEIDDFCLVFRQQDHFGSTGPAEFNIRCNFRLGTESIYSIRVIEGSSSKTYSFKDYNTRWDDYRFSLSDYEIVSSIGLFDGMFSSISEAVERIVLPSFYNPEVERLVGQLDNETYAAQLTLYQHERLVGQTIVDITGSATVTMAQLHYDLQDSVSS